MNVKTLDQLHFDNRFTNELPADPVLINRPRQVIGAAYSRVRPTPVSNPCLVHFSKEVAADIGIGLTESETDTFVNVFSGNQLLSGMDPFAMCYGGHQFGHWAGQLGDGRAINLGEVLNDQGQHWTLQLKGAGMTPYSRTADGLAVLRSSVREFLCSEAMHHLGVPTTRALSLVTTGEQVVRDMFYNGNAKPEPGAIVCRVAPSFVRFGNFQIFAAREEHELLKSLVDFTIRNDFAHLEDPSPEVYAQWFHEICDRTCDMILGWMRVGFVHGVMNTDNMSILGLTIDYGPYGWLEDYDPGWTPNTTDANGRRYRFGNQPMVAHWNLYQLGSALLSLVEGTDSLQRGLDHYLQKIEQAGSEMIFSKLGLTGYDRENDEAFKTELFEILSLIETDMTIWYRQLAELNFDSELSPQELIHPLREAYYQVDELEGDVLRRMLDWIFEYRRRCNELGLPDEDRKKRIRKVNPKYVLRNYMAQLAIDKAEQGDDSLVIELLELLRNPYEEQPGMEKYYAKRPEWARHRPGCSMLSCSS
ncbi:MAG: YdiU family protein [Planctomycetota bacterium]